MSKKVKTWIGSVKYVASGYGCSFDDVLKWDFDRFLVFYNYLIDEQNEIKRMLDKKTKYK